MRICLILLSIISLGVHSEPIPIYGNFAGSPKNYLEKKQPKGILIDIMEIISKELNVKFQYHLLPWKRAYLHAKQGDGGIISFSKNAERLEIFDYSDVMYYDDLMLVTLKDKTFPYSELADLKGKTLAALSGASYGEDFEKAVRDGVFTKLEVFDPRKRFRYLVTGQADVILISPGKISVENIMNSTPVLRNTRHNFAILPTPMKRDPNFLGFAKKMNMSAFLQRFNSALAKFHKEVGVEKIEENYLVK